MVRRLVRVMPVLDDGFGAGGASDDGDSGLLLYEGGPVE